MQRCIFSQVDFTHSARAELRTDFIATESCPGGKGHSLYLTTSGLRFMRRSRSAKRGSERIGSQKGDALRSMKDSPNDRSRYPFSSHSNARSLSPRAI